MSSVAMPDVYFPTTDLSYLPYSQSNDPASDSLEDNVALTCALLLETEGSALERLKALKDAVYGTDATSSRYSDTVAFMADETLVSWRGRVRGACGEVCGGAEGGAGRSGRGGSRERRGLWRVRARTERSCGGSGARARGLADVGHEVLWRVRGARWRSGGRGPRGHGEVLWRAIRL